MLHFLKIRLIWKVLLIEFLGVSGILVPKAIYEYQIRKAQIEDTFERDVKKLSNILVDNLEFPLWNFSPEDADSSLKSAVASSILRGIRVEDSKGELFAEEFDSDWSKNAHESKGLRIEKTRVFRADREIGGVTLYVDDREVVVALRHLVAQQVAGTALALTFILLVTFLLLRYSIIKRIYVLKRQFLKLGRRELEESFKWEAGDEVNELGMALENARVTLHKLFTDLKRSNEELATFNKNLEDMVANRTLQLVQSSRLASLGEMAGGVAHEINNPLAIISGKAQRLKKRLQELQVKGDVERDCDVIENTVERIAKIVRGLRTFSRDGTRDDFVQSTIQNLVAETLEMCRARFKNHSVDLRVDEIDPNLTIECRPVQIGQVLLNLLSNAFDATEELEEKWVELKVKDQGDTIQILVRDSGKGIPADVANRIMQPFFTTKPVGKGTGLGLSVSKGIIDTHGGVLRVDSSDPNTCFIVEVPKSNSAIQKKTYAA